MQARVLFFSPYVTWQYHTALEVTWAHALELRGADVKFVLCNGLSATCDVYRENLNPRGPLACLACQAKAAGHFQRLAMPYEWLGNYLPPGARAAAEAWAQALPARDLLAAEWKGLPVGQWAATSAYYQFRTAELRLEEPGVARSVRDLLAGTVVMLEALEVLLDEYAPDTLALLNGRFFGHWTAIELALRRGIRYVAHERGLQADTVRFNENTRTHDLAGLRAVWDEWKDVPLDPAELEQVTRVLEDRRQGKNFSRLSFSPPVQDRERVRRALGLDERPLVAVFSSSDDETAAFPERRAGAFPDSGRFLPAVLDAARARPGVQFVLRIHPNIQKREAGPNADALRHAQAMRDAAPENVRVVMPLDDVSSYTLVDLAQAGVVYASTIGLEMAALGKPVLCVAQATYSHTGCARQVVAPGGLGPALDAALRTAPDLEVARVALRWAQRYFRECSIPFDLVHGTPDDGAELRYAKLLELAPGRHEVLDRVCRYLGGQTRSVLPGPTAAERARPLEPETRCLDAWMGAALLEAAGLHFHPDP